MESIELESLPTEPNSVQIPLRRVVSDSDQGDDTVGLLDALRALGGGCVRHIVEVWPLCHEPLV